MTTEFDLIFVPLAFELIDEFGKTVVVTEVDVPSSYNPKTGLVTEDPITHTIKIIPPDMFKKAFVDGDLIETGKHVTGFAAQGLAFTPRNGMTLDLDGEIHTETVMKPIYSGDEIALYIMEFES